jgi:myo-inositol 2-dehydrogenase / D-chiro-inositol 1-dehydrogenase
VRIGIIGVGRIGAFHAQALSEHADVSEVVLADADPARARAVAAPLGARAADSIESLFSTVDAVVIAAPTTEHARLIRSAVDAGLPVFCEKPITLDLESTREVVEYVARQGATVQVGFQRRFDVGYGRARAAVQDGSLGKLYIVRMAAHDPAPPHEAYIPASGGIFRDMHIHDFDVVRFVTGQEVTEVYADGGVVGFDVFGRYDDVDTAVAVLRFSNGAFGILSGARHNPVGHDVRMELFGSKSSLAVGLDARTPLYSTEDGQPPPDKPYNLFLDRFGPAYRSELNVFLRVVARRTPNPCTPADALEAMRIAVACDVSRRERRRVALSEIG